MVAGKMWVDEGGFKTMAIAVLFHACSWPGSFMQEHAAIVANVWHCHCLALSTESSDD